MSKPLVSTIIPVYNGAAHLTETLDSVLAQTWAPHEVIAINDGSKDESAAILARYQDRVQVVHQENHGVARTRNAGIARAKGDFIAFIDQDDLWEPNKTELQVQALLDKPEAMYAITRLRFFLDEGCERPGWCKPELLVGDHLAPTPSTLMVRKGFFDIVDLFPSQYRLADDVTIFFDAKHKGLEMVQVQEVCVHRRIHGANNSGHVAAAHQELLSVVRDALKKRSA